ncbi:MULTISPECIES: hypothetical protein [Streptosporangium]|uniref:Tetratricopeptide repeat protein n=1 Tax=Streptosporangium brasiliense TaxID=47480 RepID=A0ABT9RHW1_9ACTN|nr:hypothetical protein [Streptosporangium brasiliense]MDP9868815.1 hypothetical protein [Streptosporangium brasiliense]
MLHLTHANRLRNVSQHQNALKASQQAVDLYGELTRLNPSLPQHSGLLT